ncbi:hypothetical protein SAMN05518871_108142 [Psychrobacillus sp. OK028]|uniref:hypothetical protein n=1 Tax=Psychrobacillus sp. OK028 TaxID=1884359 RepID=UPI0008882722|nr:hypothetical protein [Psychrobacillus sp. OK028]SDN90140.1 hypothetical protein SAMN05518871_108142 [Psychrobacillus sp. OK028]
MLKQIDELYKYLMITLLVIYLINSIYLQEVTITFTAIVLVVLLEITKHRHHIKQLTYSQLSIIGIVLLAGIAAIIYLLVTIQIFLEPINLPEKMESALFFVCIVLGIYILWYFIGKLFGKALEKQ